MAQGTLIKTKYQVGDVLRLTQDCELGSCNERAVVIEIDARYMTLVFPNRAGGPNRTTHTGADYAYAKPTHTALGV